MLKTAGANRAQTGGSIDNTPIGATTPSTGAFTTLSATSGINSTTIGATTANTGAFTTMKASTGAAVGGATPGAGGVAFPATAVAVADVNTLDDYEEGTWTPNQGGGLTVIGAFSSSGTYTKIGRLVHVVGQVNGATSVAVTVVGAITGNLPFSNVVLATGAATNAEVNVSVVVIASGATLLAATAIAATTTIYFTLTYTV